MVPSLMLSSNFVLFLVKEAEMIIWFREVGVGQLVAPLHLTLETRAGPCCKSPAAARSYLQPTRHTYSKHLRVPHYRTFLHNLPCMIRSSAYFLSHSQASRLIQA